MRYPGIRLTNTGKSPEVVMTFQASYGKDLEGNYVQSNTPLQIYPAVVTRSIASPSDANNRMESMTTYTVTVYSGTDPEVNVNEVVLWQDTGSDIHALKAQGDAISSGPGSYQFASEEIDSVPDGTIIPVQGSTTIGPLTEWINSLIVASQRMGGNESGSSVIIPNISGLPNENVRRSIEKLKKRISPSSLSR